MNESGKEFSYLPIPRLGKWVISILFLTALFLRHDIAMQAITHAGHDDGLFFRGLENLLAGSWLGSYDNLTLAKGPMLSIVAAIAALLGLSIKTFEFLIYLSACLLFVALVFRLTRSSLLSILLFAAFAFNPVFWNSSALRFIREPLYIAVSLAVVGLLAWLLWLPFSQRSRILLAGALGGMFGLFWLTREESLWIYPSLFIILAYALFLAFARRSDRLALVRNAVSAGQLLVGWVIGFALVLLPVLTFNYFYYGAFITNEFREAPFRQAVGALMHIKAPVVSPYVPVSHRARELAYSVSPAATELKPYLEGQIGAGWALPSASLPLVNEGEIAGGWFIWALRDAAAAAGHHRDAASAAAFYRRMAEEINAACADGRLGCGPRRDTLAPPFDWRRFADFADSSLQASWMIIRLESNPITPVVSQDPIGRLGVWSQWLGRVAPTASKPQGTQIKILGWIAAHAQHIPSLTLRGPDLQHLTVDVAIAQASDVDRHFVAQGRSDMVSRRFSLMTDCISDGCNLLALAGNEKIFELPIVNLQRGPVGLTDQVVFYIDTIDTINGSQALNTQGMDRHWLEPLKFLVVYNYQVIANTLFPLLWGTATLGLLLYGALDRRDAGLNALAIMMLAALAAVGTRATLIAYIDVTSWRSINSLYLSPAYGFAIIYAVCGSYLLCRTVFRKIAPNTRIVNVDG